MLDENDHDNKLSNMNIAWEQCTYGVILASPVGQRTPGQTSGTLAQASFSSGPAALWMAEERRCMDW